jgi:hypothetical protein
MDGGIDLVWLREAFAKEKTPEKVDQLITAIAQQYKD